MDKELELIKELIKKTEDKDTIGKLSELSSKLEEKNKSFKEEEEKYLNEISKWRDAYKESILKGGFQSKEEVGTKADSIENKIPTFEDLLEKYAK